MLEEANKCHPNIKLTYEIGNDVSFLDVKIRNEDGNLITSVYHKEAAEPYVVPFKSDHPRHIFQNIIQYALLRTLRYSSTLPEFNHERRTIKLMLIYNGYPIRYIYRHFNKFFNIYNITSTSILPMIHDKNEYLLLRHQLLALPTPSEHARASRIASQMDYNNPPSTSDPLVQSKLLKWQKESSSLKQIIIHYTYEQRLAYYKSKIHQKWNDLFQETSVMETKLIVGTRNNPNLTKELVRRSPYLQKRPKKQQKADNQTENQSKLFL
ncbi:unnamed protein product [Rotaria sp. Silwood2]|nr:unnamed protein product [Rotaria sp. Silwood2]CAF4663679.1 unnamed protein product [Rotaria sp. Silwood2]